MELLCIEFINSQWYKTHKMFKEPLKDEKWFKDFCVKWNLSITHMPDKEMMTFVKERGIAIHSGPFQPNPHIKFFYILDPNGLKIHFSENI